MDQFGKTPNPGNQGQIQAGQPQVWQTPGQWSQTPPPPPTFSGTLAPGMGATLAPKVAQWTALPVLSLWMKIIAWIGLVGGALGFLIVLISGFSLSATMGNGAIGTIGFVYAVILLMAAVIGFLYNMAASELIGVFLAIEKNTRKE